MNMQTTEFALRNGDVTLKQIAIENGLKFLAGLPTDHDEKREDLRLLCYAFLEQQMGENEFGEAIEQHQLVISKRAFLEAFARGVLAE